MKETNDDHESWRKPNRIHHRYIITCSRIAAVRIQNINQNGITKISKKEEKFHR